MPVDDEGMVTERRRASSSSALRREGRRCKLIYTIVNFQNPSGPTLSLRRRQELIELAHEFDTLILEDDAYGELRFEGEAPALALRARRRRPRHPRGHGLQDPRRGRPPRLALRARAR